MRKYSFTTYFSVALLLLNTNALTIGFALIGFGLVPNVYALEGESKTALLDELKLKFDLDNPERNHQVSGLTGSMEDQMNPESVDLTQSMQEALNRLPQSHQYDFSEYAENESSDSLLEEERKEGLFIGQTHGMPDVQDDGSTQFEYATEGTRKFKTDSDGNRWFEVVEDVEMVDSIGKEDMFSQEVNNESHVFETPEAYGDENKVIDAVQLSHSTYRDNETSTGRAYQVVSSSMVQGINTTIDSNSAFLQPSIDTFESVNSNEGDYFQACQVTTENVDSELNFPTYEDFRCESTTTDNPFFCEVSRELRVPAVISSDNLTSCGVGCYEMTIGDETRNNYLNPSGGCGLYEHSNMLTLNLTDGIELDKILFVEGYVDDHIEFTVDGKLAFSMTDSQLSYNEGITEENYQQCEIGGGSHLGRWYYTGDKTHAFERHFEEGENRTYNLGWNVLVGGEGEFHAKIRFYFKDTLGKGYGEIETQYPEGCKDKVSDQILNAGGVNKLYEQGLDDSEIEYSFCRFDEITPLEEGEMGFSQDYLDLLGPMYPGDIANKTWKYEMGGYECDPLGGKEYCITDPETLELVCYTWDDLDDLPNYCEPYETDSSCKEVSRECTREGWHDGNIGWEEGEEGEEGDVVENDSYCFNETVTFQCETNNTVPYSTTVTSSNCDAALPCAGGNCAFGEDESNEKFVEAAVRANVIQNADADRACEDASDPTTCRIFEGEAKFCSWEVTGLGMDCCESPGGINILAYVGAAQVSIKMGKLVANGAAGATAQSAMTSVIDPVQGVWTKVTEPLADEWSAVTDFTANAINTAVDTVFGNATQTVATEAGTQAITAAGAPATEGAISLALQKLEAKVGQVVYDMLPEQMGEMLFTDAALQSGNNEVQGMVINESIANFASNVMFAYQVYSFIKLGLQLLTMCEEEEADMGIKLGQRQCFKVGGSYCSSKVLGICYQKRQDYCCYSSILARIIMEQAGPLINKDMTSCEGLTQEEFSLLDFDQIDLSEWVGLLVESGDIKSEADEQILTGSGEVVGQECETYTVTDPETGVETEEMQCFDKFEGGRILNAGARQTVTERTTQKVAGLDNKVDGLKSTARGVANNLDCSASPRPKVCEFSIDPTDTVE